MTKDKSIITISVPTEVKHMLVKLAELTFSSNTKVIVDLIRKDYTYRINNKNGENNV